MILSDPRQHKFASCSRRATALGCIWTLVEGLGFCGTVDSGMPVPRLQRTAELGTRAPALLLTLLEKPLLEAQTVLSPSPFNLYPSKVLPTCGTSVLQSMHPSTRMLPSPPPGEGSSRWEMPAVLWLVSGPTSSHFDGQSTPWWHSPALWIPSWSNRLNHFSFLFHCFHLFPPWPFLFLPDLFFFPLSFFHLFSFLFSLLKVFSYGKARGNSVRKQMHRDSKNIDGRVHIPNALPVLNDAHRWMRYWCVGSVFLTVFLFHEPVLSPPHPCQSTCREQCYEVLQGKCPCQKEPPFFVNISCLPALSCYHFKVISKIFNLLNSEWIVII